ncbi:hypothetical protein [Phenylobacterium sp.]|uniref:hypothetical protein n=1 Tax=Phenylobacterium sp. TaxID=1871053 RepID=UPI00398379B6
MIRNMTAILYPVAANADEALARPSGRAARQRDAATAAGEPVVFTTDPLGAAYATREAALDAYAGCLDDHRSAAGPAVEDRYCALIEQTTGAAAAPVQPTYEDGRRWPRPAAQPATTWRLQVSYWRIATPARPIAAPQARHARRSRQTLDPAILHAISRQPLRPVEPQQPLDIGLFEIRLPENPNIIVPDE